VVTAGAEMMVRAFIVNCNGLAAAGFYCAGFMLIDAYGRFLFTSMDADYYPRLSAITHDEKRQNDAINRQIEVCLLLIAPFLIAFALFVPVVVRLLFTEEFLKVVPMVLCGLFYLYFKAITTPVAYLPLAKGDSVMYFTMETLYCVFFVCILSTGYTLWGLTGAGIALSASNLFDMAMVCTVYHLKYGYRFSARVVVTGVGQGLLLVMGLYVAFQTNLWLKYLCGAPVLAVSTVWAVRTLSKETEFVSAIRRRIFRK
jgi:O-antigen/teichoic acid export membrane protein